MDRVISIKQRTREKQRTKKTRSGKRCARFVSAVLTLSMVMSGWVMPQITASAYSGGSGTEASPYLISNANDLKQLVTDGASSTQSSNATNGKYYKMTADIDLNPGKTISGTTSGATKWTPIPYFFGTFDGGKHVIKGLYGNSLFNEVKDGAIVKNLGIKASYIALDPDKGGLVGGIVRTVEGASIISCYNEGSISNGYGGAGGIVGYLKDSRAGKAVIRNCYNAGTIRSYGDTGGIAGEVSTSYYGAEITACYNSASIDAVAVRGGGIAGKRTFGSGTNISVSNCYNRGTITANATYVTYGILEPGTDSTGRGVIISNCYTTSGTTATGVTTVTDANMKATSTLNGLNTGATYYALDSTKNSGYPYLLDGAAPTITASNVTKTYGDAAFKLGASVNSGGTLTYSSSNTNVATIASDGTITIKAAGTSTITINAAAKGNYLAGSKAITLTVNKANPTITASNVTKTYGNAAFKLGAAVNSGGTLTYSSSNTGVATIASDGTITIKAVGSSTITINAAAAGSYNAGSKTITLTVNKADTSWKSGNATYTATYGGSVNIAHVANSGGTVTYKVKSGSATISGSTVTPSAAGTVVVTVTAAATGNYNAISRDVTITVGKANTSWKSGNASYNATYGGSAVNIAHAANSGGTVTYSVKSGGNYITLSGSNVTPKAAGTATITVTAAATGNYNAISRDITVTVAKANASWSSGNTTYTATYGGSVNIAHGANSGGTVTYKVKSGSATISGSTVTPSAAGTVVVTVTAAATGNYNAISRDVTITVGKANTSWKSGNATYSATYGGNVDIAHVANSGGTVTYTLKSGSATISGSKVTPTAASTVVVTVTAAATGNHNAISRDVTITVGKANTSWKSGNTSYSATYGGSAISVAHVANSGGTVTYSVKSGGDYITLSGSNVTPKAAGTATITVTAAATGNYNAISRDITVTVAKANASWSGETTFSRAYASGNFSIAQTVSSGAAPAYTIASGSDVIGLSGSTVTIKKAGTASVTVSAPANANYNAPANRTINITITKAGRTITTPTTAFTKTYGDAPFKLGATISAGTMSYTSSNTGVVTVAADGTATIKGVGSATITVASVADSNYSDAQSKQITVAVNATTPDAPVIKAVSGQNTQVTITWTAPPFTGGNAITGYILQRSENGGAYTTVAQPSSLDTMYVDRSLTNGTTYSYRMYTVTQSGNSADSSAVVTAKPYTVPSAPSEFSASAASSTAAQLTWKAPQSNGGDDITSYTVKVYSNSAYTAEVTNAQIGAPALSNGVYTASVSGLAKGTTYYFTVSAVNKAGNGAAAKTDATTWTNPSAPRNVSASAASRGAVKVTWQESENNGGTPVTGYILSYRAKDTQQWTVVNGIKDTSYTVTGLSAGTTYQFMVKAVNAADENGGAESNIAEMVAANEPSAPKLGELVSKDKSLLVTSITNTDNNGSVVTGYVVYYRAKGADDYKTLEVNAKSENAENVLITGISNGVEYEVAAAAVNGIGEGEKSEWKSVKSGLPTVPQNVTITPRTGQMLYITFDPSDGQGSVITDYYLYINGTRQGNQCEEELVRLNGNVTEYTYNAGERLNGDTISVQVSAKNSAGESARSVAATSYVGAPSAPVLTKYVTDENGVALAWNASSPNGNALRFYTVYITDENGVKKDFDTKNSLTCEMYINKEQYQFEPGKTYTASVTCTNMAGEGVASNEGKFTFAAPAVPQEITGETGDGTLTVSWKKPLNNGGYEITGYNIYLNDDKEATATVTWKEADGKYQLYVNDHRNNSGSVVYGTPQDNLDSFSVVIEGLANGFAYTANVTAINEMGEGPSGGIIEPETPKTKAGAPLDVKAEGISGTEIRLNWKKPLSDGGTPISKYTVRAYKVSQKDYTTGEYKEIKRSDEADAVYEVTSGTSLTASGLMTGYGYEFEVCAVTAAEEGAAAKSNIAMTHTKPSKPVITELYSGVGSEESLPLTVKWSAPEDDGNSEIIGYDIYVNNQFKMNKDIIGADTFEYEIRDSRIKNGTKYNVTVVAYNAVTGTVKSKGTSSDSVGITVGSVPAPKGVKLSGDRYGNLRVTWPLEQYKNIMSYIDRYVIYVNGEVITTTRNNSVELTMRSLSEPQTVQVAVISIAGHEGNKSEPQTIILGAPDMVTGVKAAADKESITVTWNAADNDINTDQEFYPNKYTVYVDGKEAGTVGNGEDPVADGTEMKKVISGLKGGKEYAVTVTASNSYGESLASDAVKAAPWSEPDEPAVSDITPGLGSFSFVFADGSGNGADITGHKVYVDGAEVTSVTYSGNKATVTGVQNGVEHSFYIAAVNSKNLETKVPSNLYTVVTGVPAPPANVRVKALVDSAEVSFDKSADISSEYSVTGYDILKITNSGDTVKNEVVKTITSTGAANYSEVIGNLTEGEEYSFAVRAVNRIGEGAWSRAVSVKPGTPEAPVIGKVTPSSAKLTLEWSAPKQNAGKITKYAVYVNGIEALTTPKTSGVISGLDNGSEYVITVSAYNYVGEGAMSAPVKAAPGGAPEVVTDVNSELTYADGEGCGIILTWSEPLDDGGLPIDEYKVTGQGNITVNSDERKAIVTGLEQGEIYTFDIIAHSQAGDGETFTTDKIKTLDIPSAPTLIGGNSYNNMIMVTWAAPKDNGGSDIEEYIIYARPADGGEAVVWSGLPEADENGEYTVTITEGIVKNQKYDITVKAVNVIGESKESASTRVQVNGTIVQTKPSEPTNMKATAGDGSVTITWSAPVDDGNSTITSYSIWAGNSEDDMGVIATVNGYTFTYKEENIPNGTERFYKVKAVNGVDADGGPFSKIVSETPTKINAPSAPVWPEFDNTNGVSAYETNAQGTEMTITWNESTGDESGGKISYEVYVNGELKDTVTTGTSYILKNLKENERYNIQIKAVNEAGAGTLSEYIRAYKNLNIRKGKAEDGFNYDEHYSEGIYANIDADYNSEEDYQISYSVPSAPQNAALTTAVNKAIVTWDTPAMTGNKAIDGYYVYVNGQRYDVIAEEKPAARALSDEAEYSYDFDIEYGQPYTVYVKAYNSVGAGEATDLMYITPSIEAPSALQADFSDKVNVNIDLSWTIGNDAVTGYVLYVNGKPQTIDDITLEEGEDYLHIVHYTYKGEINQTYYFALAAKYGDVESTLSDTVTVSTDEALLPAPQNVEVSGSGYDVTVSWTPLEDTDDLQAYYIYVNGDKFAEAASDAEATEIAVEDSCMIRVAAVCGHGVVGTMSEAVKYSIGTGIDYGSLTPPAPVNVDYQLDRPHGILAENDNITVTWEDGKTDSNHRVFAQSYKVKANGKFIDEVESTECTFTVEAGKDYNITIQPVAYGEAGPEYSLAVEVPANEYPAPAKPVLSAKLNDSKTAVTLTWNAEEAVVYYLIVNGVEQEEALSSEGAATMEFNYDLSADTANYTFKLKAVKIYENGGEGTVESNIVNVSTGGNDDKGTYASDKPVITGTLSYGTKVKVYWTAPKPRDNERGVIYEYRAVIDGVEQTIIDSEGQEQPDAVEANASPLVYTVSFDNVTDKKTIEIRAYKRVNARDFVASVSDPWIITPNCNVLDAEHENDFINNNTDADVSNKDTTGNGKPDNEAEEITIPISVNAPGVTVDIIDAFGNQVKNVGVDTDADGVGEITVPADGIVNTETTFKITVRKDGYTSYTVTDIPYADLSKAGKLLENVILYVGDINGDGRVDSTDRIIVKGNIGLRENISLATGDVNGDGRIDSTDRILVNSNIGRKSQEVKWSDN